LAKACESIVKVKATANTATKVILRDMAELLVICFFVFVGRFGQLAQRRRPEIVTGDFGKISDLS
jgi:hypothetical protein